MRARRLVVLLVLVAVVLAPAADAKFEIRLALSADQPAIGERVDVTLRTERPLEAGQRLRLIAVPPRVDIYSALSWFVGSRAAGPVRGAFEVPLTASGIVWRGQVRFPRAGRWRLVVPNWGAPGYAMPPPVVQVVAVRPNEDGPPLPAHRNRGFVFR